MSRWIGRLAAALVASSLSGQNTSARADMSMHLAVGQAGSITYELGVAVSSLIKTVVLPSDGIDLTIVETIAEGQTPLLLVADQAQFALVPTPRVASSVPGGDMRRILTFWSDEQSEESSIELIVRADVPTDVVSRISRTILDNEQFLGRHSGHSWSLVTDRKLARSHLPLHQGAIQLDSGQGLPELAADIEPIKSSAIPSADASSAQTSGNASFFLYFEKGQDQLDETAKLRVAAACEHAKSSNARYIRVVGYASSSEENDDVEGLVLQRSVLVSTALSSDDRCQGLIEIVDATAVQSSLPTGLSAGGDDRVEVTVMPAR